MSFNQPLASVVEYVEFLPVPSASDLQVLDALKQTDALLAEIEGFVHRDLAKRDNYWVEVVFWRDQASADAGLEAFIADARSAPLFKLIDSDSVEIKYSKLIS